MVKNPDFNKILGKHLRLIRDIEKDMTIEEVEHLANMADKSLGVIERGNTNPTAYTLFKLYVVMGFSMDRLFHNVKKELDSLNNNDFE